MLSRCAAIPRLLLRTNALIAIPNISSSMIESKNTNANSQQHSRICSFQTSRSFSSSQSSDNTEKVILTKTIHAKTTSNPQAEQEEEEQQQQSSGCCGGSSREKQPDQIAEEEMMHLQGLIREHHQTANYNEALQSCNELIDKTESHFGTNHPATASAYNNAAVMHKMMGEFEFSRRRYHDALRVYGDIVGKDHSSYAAALNNLGNLARAQAQTDEALKGLERLQLNETAMDHFEEALRIRTVELGEDHPHTLTSRSNLGGTLATLFLQQVKATNKATQSDDESDGAALSKFTMQRCVAAEEHLRGALIMSMKNQTDMEIKTLSSAAAAQNLAVFLKCRADVHHLGGDIGEMYAEARHLYDAALAVRTSKLGNVHPDTVATKFSLAELLTVVGDEDGANSLRQEIIDSLEDIEEEDDDEDKTATAK